MVSVTSSARATLAMLIMLDATKSALMKVFVMSFSLLAALLRRIAGAPRLPSDRTGVDTGATTARRLFIFDGIMPKKYHLSRRC